MARVGFCPSGRFFEAAACGTPIISDWFNGLDHFFAPQKEIFIVRDTDEVLQALQSSDDEVARIASAACERTLAEHTGERRAVQLIQYLEDVFARRAKSIAEVA